MDFKGLIRTALNLFPLTRNYGIQKEDTTVGLGAVPFEVLQPDGQWTDYLPEYEYQNIGLEKMSCVTFSLLNCLEILSIRKYKAQFDFNDRFTAVMSGTTFTGNSLYKVFQSVLKDGVVSLWDDGNAIKTWNEYYTTPPDYIKRLGKENLKELQFGMEWVAEPLYPERLMEALKYSPLWITLYAYGTIKDGVHQNADGKDPNHAVTLIGYDEGICWYVFDHYKGNEVRRIAWDYRMGCAARINFKWLSKES